MTCGGECDFGAICVGPVASNASGTCIVFGEVTNYDGDDDYWGCSVHAEGACSDAHVAKCGGVADDAIFVFPTKTGPGTCRVTVTFRDVWGATTKATETVDVLAP
jgi:hypothetical protein